MSDMGPIPRGALIGASLFVGSALLLASAPALGLLDRPTTPQAARQAAGVRVVVQRDLRFLDRADGAVVVEDAAGNVPVDVIASGSNQGFIRGVMRGMARDRRMRGVGSEAPFRLALWADGRLSLADSATGRTVELDGFGADNRAAFARLLGPRQQVALR